MSKSDLDLNNLYADKESGTTDTDGVQASKHPSQDIFMFDYISSRRLLGRPYT